MANGQALKIHDALYTGETTSATPLTLATCPICIPNGAGVVQRGVSMARVLVSCFQQSGTPAANPDRAIWRCERVFGVPSGTLDTSNAISSSGGNTQVAEGGDGEVLSVTLGYNESDLEFTVKVTGAASVNLRWLAHVEVWAVLDDGIQGDVGG